MRLRDILTVGMLAVVAAACTNNKTAGMKWELETADGWIPAQVPSTVMGVLGENTQIDKKQFDKGWTYRATFEMPELKEGEHALLDFDGISYRANVWLNNEQIADSATMFGPFRQFEYDVTKQIADDNVLKVEVFRAQPGEPNIGFVDWNPRPLDESMGIFREVRIKTCGNVAISHSAVRSRVNTETLKEAWITITTELKNLSDKPVKGTLKGIADESKFSYPVELAAGETLRFVAPEEIHIKDPRLWWCHNMGLPELCDLHVEFVENDKVSDKEDVRFGIREIHSYLTDEGYRGYILNGKKVLLRGAGWTDELSLSDTPETNRLQLEYVRDMNMNTVRLEGFWGSSQNLYDLCDELGLFILVGWSCHWEWADYIGAPCDDLYGGILSKENIDLIARSFEDQVMWLRYHPSIIGWFVGSDMIPKPELEKKYQEFLSKADNREYIISAKDQKSEISGPSGTKMAGPYEYVGPSYWYLPDAPGGAFGFNTETGIGAQLPVKESLQKMLGEKLFPIDDRYNSLCTASSADMNSLKQLNEVISNRFGEAKDIDEYLRRADMLNYESTKAMFESFRVRWPHTTGIIQWMLNGARPGIYWQLYDYFKQPNAAYYGVKKANAPVQLIYDYYNKAVYAVNETLETAKLKATMKLLKGSNAAEDAKQIEVAPGTMIKVFDIGIAEAPAAFLFLKLKDGDNEVATNEYFIPAGNDVYDWSKTTWVNTPITQYASYAMLDGLCSNKCEIDVNKGEDDYRVTVYNPTDKVAFMVRLTARDKQGNLICPAYWSDNYLTLAPGESRTVTCRMSSITDKTEVEIGVSK